ncbi:DUF938 domain-containing protein [Pelagibius sp. Alg239-R121]|uniref:DUF938 domain-containing protein n=1 Tax=Pelagibius sp. Alg239-R121 TaxID=2993448 RepID=UPI002AC3256B|nr:DUF938 domain-containing protein [Pelagibius sp. Alg239-R121]
MIQSEQAPDFRRFAPATQRNREPLFKVLSDLLPARGKVLEIASGTGEHAVWLAQHMPGLTWQTSDPNPDLRQSIASHAAHAKLTLPLPMDIDVTASRWMSPDESPEPVDAVFCANMIHIAPWAATLGLLSGAARHLKPGGKLCLYGPFKRGGAHTAPSNEAFDHSLRSQNSDWGVRELEVVTEEALKHGFQTPEIIEMPSNNLTLVFEYGALVEGS